MKPVFFACMMLFGTADLVLQAAIPAQARNPSWTEMLGPAQDTIPQAEGFKVVWRHDLQAAIAEAKAPTPLPTKQAFVGILTAVNDQSPNLAAAPSSSVPPAIQSRRTKSPLPCATRARNE